MSDEAKISDRPVPFEVKTAILQLVGIAVGTPSEVGDMAVKVDMIINFSVNVRIYPGGYSSQATAFDETVYFHGQPNVSDAVKRLNDLIGKVNGVLANGRKIRLAAVKKKAAAMLEEVRELEASLANETKSDPSAPPSDPIPADIPF